jgi:hypothetical protein
MFFRRAGFLLCVAALASACGHLAAPRPALPMQNQALVPPVLSSSSDAISPNATNPTLWICDAAGQIWTVQLGTYAIKRIGLEGSETVLTDIAFDKAGNLYGLSFNQWYRVSKSNGQVTPVGSLGITDANALVINANGVGYTEGYQVAKLYKVNIANGITTAVGPTGSYKSAGDLTFYNGTLILSGITGTSPSSDIDYIVTLSEKTGAVLSAKKLAITKLYALASTGTNALYGFADKSLYRINPGASTPAGRTVLLKTFSTPGLARVLGLAYDGNFQP